MAPLEGPVAADSAAVAADAASINAASVSNGVSGNPPKWRGRILKRFKLVDLLGQGAMGKVFRAEDITLRRYVALKVLPTKTKQGERDHKIDQFVREARSAATIEHPGAVTIYEIGESSGVHYIAMELVEGGNLEKLIKASGPMEIERACQIAAEAAEALAAAHSLGIIHRDVKPSNLLLARNGRCKLADFGLARYDDPEDLTLRGECVGTPCYIAPELPLGQKATPQSDIYSLGCTLWFLLTGRPPFEAKTKQDMIKMHVYASLPDLRERRADVPERLVEAVERACAKNPSDRFDSADQFAKVLRTFTIRTGSSGGSSSRLSMLGGSSGAVGAGAGASGSLPAWNPAEGAPPLTSASSSNLGPHLSHTATHFGPIPPMVGSGSQPTVEPRNKLNAPIVWAAFGTVAAAVLIGVGVWIARGSSGGGNDLAAADTPRGRGAGTQTVSSSAAPARTNTTSPPRTPGASGDAVTTLTNVLSNGGLEADDGVDGLEGWYIAPKYHAATQFIDEDGNRFVRITPANDKDTPHVDQKIELDPTWTSITVAARMRATNLKVGPKGDARVAVEFVDENDGGRGAPGNVPRLRSDSAWHEQIQTIRIPDGAKAMYVKLITTHVTGTVDFDDVRVIPQIAGR